MGCQGQTTELASRSIKHCWALRLADRFKCTVLSDFYNLRPFTAQGVSTRVQILVSIIVKVMLAAVRLIPPTLKICQAFAQALLGMTLLSR